MILYSITLTAASTSLDALFDQLFNNHVIEDSFLLNHLKLPAWRDIEAGLYLNNVSPMATLHKLASKKADLQALRDHEEEFMQASAEQQISYKVLYNWLTLIVAGEKFLFHGYKINQMGGALVDLLQLLTQYHTLASEQDVQHYFTCLTKVPEYIEQIIDFLEHQNSLGIIYPRCALEKIIITLTGITPHNVTENVFYTYLAGRLDDINGIDAGATLTQAQIIIQQIVHPALNSLLAYCTTMLKTSQDSHGVWALPDGDEYYAYQLKCHTTTDLSAQQIHDIGLAEVQKIQDEMRMILAGVGIADEQKSLGQLMDELNTDQQFYFPETDSGREQCLKHYAAILERSRRELGPLFNLKPKAPVIVSPVPKHNEDGASAYYAAPSFDGSRPGTFFINMRNLKEIPTYGMETLLIHEAEPGHHFQVSLQLEAEAPLLRKIIGHIDNEYTAYIEGWALYVEKLAYERGFYSSPYACLGHLQDELLRAIRLVIDTGIHHKRWTREYAIDYMVDATGYARDTVVSEVERYFVMPGQACAYKIGQLKILELRARAQEALGEKFDIRDFHNAVLTLGAAPLTLLEDVIDGYIEDKK